MFSDSLSQTPAPNAQPLPPLHGPPSPHLPLSSSLPPRSLLSGFPPPKSFPSTLPQQPHHSHHTRSTDDSRDSAMPISFGLASFPPITRTSFGACPNHHVNQINFFLLSIKKGDTHNPHFRTIRLHNGQGPKEAFRVAHQQKLVPETPSVLLSSLPKARDKSRTIDPRPLPPWLFFQANTLFGGKTYN